MRIGIDLGGTKTEGILMDAAGEIIERLRQPTPAADGYAAILDNIADIVDQLDKVAGRQCRVGIGTPGSLSPTTGLLRNSNTTCLNQMPVKQDIEQRLGRTIRIANDANCFALSEAVDGAGSNYSSVFGVIMGTGVGGGIVFNKQLHQGSHHIAGEWGHNVLDPNGPDCYCGRKGCVETFLSGPGLINAYRLAGGDAAMSTADIVSAAGNGDAVAGKVFASYIDAFGKALATVINILDPEVVVLGGGMSNIEPLYSDGVSTLAKYVFNEELLTPVLPNRHGDSGGVRGAAWLWSAAEAT